MHLENHVCAPAYKDADVPELASICDHVTFNSITQYLRHHKTVERCGDGHCSMGLRINPEFSTQDKAIYDPCAPGSRLGITYDELVRGLSALAGVSGDSGEAPAGGRAGAGAGDLPPLPPDIEGLHFHTLCEQGADALVQTFSAFEARFAPYLKQVRWLNLGGGHHITRPGYDIDALKKLINYIRATYGLDIYLEPGEAVALNAGYLVCEVCDIVHNGDIATAILDTSAACHMPDVLEMPYRPPLRGAAEPGVREHTYRLASISCLAGDVIGDYSFDHTLRVGDHLVFEDMAIYTMCKNNTFNGVPLPSIMILKENGDVRLIREFGYDDFKCRLS